jgi:MFS family permease
MTDAVIPKNKPFYGWTIAVTLWFTYLLSVGLPFYGASVINSAMGKSLQLDKTTIGLGFSTLLLVWGLSGPLVALLLNRRGLRLTVVIGALIITAGALALALFVREGWLYVVVFGIVNGIGIGIASNLPTQTGIALWFSRKRALMMSLVMTASGVGGFIAPPLLNLAIGFGDWRTAWLLIAAGALFCAVIAAIFLRDRPADLGQYPDGIAPDASAPAATHTDGRWTVRQVFARPAFWQILFAGIALSLPGPLLVAHGVTHLENLGHQAAIGAWAIGLMLLFSVPGRLVGGYLCDRFPPRRVWAAMLILMVIGVSLFITAHATDQIIVFAALMGIGYGASIICWAAITAHYFGPASFATVMGMQTPISTLVTSAAPTLAGMLYDRTGSVAGALWIAIGVAVLAAVLVLSARVPPVPAPVPLPG